MRSWLLSSALLVASCAAPVLQVDLPPPPALAQSLLTGVLHDGRLSVFAVDLEADPQTWALPAVERRRGDARFFAMYYERSLELLDLQAGPQTLVDEGVAPSPSSSIFLRTVSDDDEGGWLPVEGLSGKLQFRLPERPVDQSKCRPMRISAHRMPTDKRITVALPQSGGRVFAVSVDGQGFMIDGAEISDIGRVVDDTVLSGVELSDGVTWLSGHDGRLWSGVPSGTFANTHQLRPGQTARYLAGPSPGMEVPPLSELFALSSTGSLSQLGYWGGWRADKELVREDEPSTREGGLLWLAPDRAAALIPGTGRYFRIDIGVVTEYEVAPERVGRVDSIAANYGAVFGITDNGDLVRFTEQGETIALETQLGQAVSDPQLMSVSDGFLIVNRPSTLRFWYRPTALDAREGVVPPNIICPAIPWPEAGDSIVWGHAVVGETAYLFMSPFHDWDGGPTTMLIVDFSRP